MTRLRTRPRRRYVQAVSSLEPHLLLAFHGVLALTRGAIDGIQQQLSVRAELNSFSSDASFSDRPFRSQRFVLEGQWRLQLIRHISSTQGATTFGDEFSMAQRLSVSPSTLFCWCLLHKDYESAGDVVTMYHLSDELLRKPSLLSVLCAFNDAPEILDSG